MPSSTNSSLPSGWTEHLGPQGQVYYYNSISKQSTYTKPTDSTTGTSTSTSPSTTTNGSNTKADKPLSKVPIPDTDGWLKVTTTLGNVFYSHKPTKRSEWTVPPEIKSQVDKLNEELERKEEKMNSQREEESEDSNSKRKREEVPLGIIDSKDDASSSKRPRTEQDSSSAVDQQQSITEFVSNPEGGDEERQDREGAEEDEGEDGEENEDEEWQRQMAAEMAAEAQEQEEMEKLEQENQENQEMRESSERREVSSSLNPPGPPPSKPPSDQFHQPQPQPQSMIPVQTPHYSGPPPPLHPNFSIPPPPISYQHPPPLIPAAPIPTNFSHEESLALFKHMLTTLNGTKEEIDPMAPWDKELPKFVHRIEYSRLNSLKDRQEAFNDWCKVRLREKRAEKAKAKGMASSTSFHSSGKGKEKDQREAHLGPSSSTSNGNSSKEKEEEEEQKKSYRALLKENVTSTRMIWDDFKKKFKKDRRFFGFGRDDKIREKVFREWLRELGETKRLAAIQAEKDFKVLLSEKLSSASDHVKDRDQVSKEEISDLWKKLKQTPGLVEDDRYEKVGSSSKRLELFGFWLKNDDEEEQKNDRTIQISNHSKDSTTAPSSSIPNSTSKNKSEQREKALKEREEQVRKSRNELNRTNQSALNQIQKQDSSLQFNQFLIDEIKDPNLTFDQISRTFEKDPRFDNRDLSWGSKRALVEGHLNNLFEKKRNSLRKLLEEITKGSLDLDEKEDEVLIQVGNHEEFERLKLDKVFGKERLEREFKIWKNEKYEKARMEFQEMLKENAFISFWGKLRKEKEGGKEEESGDGEEKANDSDEEDQPDLLNMAQKIDLEEVHSVLRNDQRYRIFKHLPEKRDEWIRDHLSSQAKLKQTVHQK